MVVWVCTEFRLCGMGHGGVGRPVWCSHLSTQIMVLGSKFQIQIPVLCPSFTNILNAAVHIIPPTSCSSCFVCYSFTFYIPALPQDFCVFTKKK